MEGARGRLWHPGGWSNSETDCPSGLQPVSDMTKDSRMSPLTAIAGTRPQRGLNCLTWMPHRAPSLPHAHTCDRPHDHAEAERHHCPLCGCLWARPSISAKAGTS